MTRSQIISILEDARVSRGLTYKALAFRAGLTPDNLRGILQGWSEPKLDTLLRICSVLKIEVTAAPSADAE